MSKKILVASIFGIVIVAFAVWNFDSVDNDTLVVGEEPATEVSAIDSAERVVITGELASSTDDGVWRETLQKTLAASSTKTIDEIKTTDDKETQTDVLTRDLLGPYFRDVQNETYTKESGELLAKSVAQNALQMEYIKITDDTLTLITNATDQDVVVYKKNLYEALSPMFSLTEYELTIYARATEKNTKHDFDLLKTYAQKYRDSSDNALRLMVPSDIAAVHLDIVNSLYKFATVLETMASGFDDPVRSLSGVNNFTRVEEEFKYGFDRLKTYFILRDANDILL